VSGHAGEGEPELSPGDVEVGMADRRRRRRGPGPRRPGRPAPGSPRSGRARRPPPARPLSWASQKVRDHSAGQRSMTTFLSV
jgi:hypothetical protein